MQDYWLTRYLLNAVGWAYIGITVAALVVAIKFTKTTRARLSAVLIVVCLMSILPWKGYQEYRREQAVAEEFKRRYAEAKAIFDERCKTAGSTVYRKVTGVDGVILLSLRPLTSGETAEDANAIREIGGDGYIRSFLMSSKDAAGLSLIHDQVRPPYLGFQFVEAIDQRDGKRYRYTLKADMSLNREVSPFPAPRFAVIFNDPVIQAERRHWIASSTVQVLDTQTGETLGESKRFAMDPGLGSRAGQRTPWLFARGCASSLLNPYAARQFAIEVLNPSDKATR